MQGGANAILVVLLALLFLACGGALLWARRKGQVALGRRLGKLMLAIPAAYLGALLLASLTSHERVLGLHEPVTFCGLYLDCHISVAVEQVDTAKTLGVGPAARTAQGVFYVVMVKYSSDAIRATLSPGRPTATVLDARGRTFRRSPEGEGALAATQGKPVPLLRHLAPGEFELTVFVFDLPEDLAAPRLRLSPGTWVERLTELLLVGDDDSLLHRRTTIRLLGAA